MLGSVIRESNPMAAAAAVSIQDKSCSMSSEIEWAECDCCGLKEECTPAYINCIRERFQGRWICGLCAEAVEDEIARSATVRLITTEEALSRHMTFSKSGGGPPTSDPTVLLISAVRTLLRRSLGSPGSGLRSTTVTKARRRSLTRSESCVD